MKIPFLSIKINSVFLFFTFLVFIFLFSFQTVFSQEMFLNPSPKREFRAVWIASVGNIDFPSKSNLNSKAQREEFVSLVNLHSQNNLNALIVQVRPSGDALYPSVREPWSSVLTGKVGQMPMPYYDPLVFMIEETHKKSMEFHAWFNPFRAVMNSQKIDLPANHITKLHPEWFMQCGNNLVFNPGEPAAREFVREIIIEVVMRYDIDGVHLDDYFYPYPDAGIYDDKATFEKYGKGNFATIEEWRRDNINTFIKETSFAIKNIKPYIKFGISPCAVWRNQSKDKTGSDTKGVSAYDDLHADTRLWLQRGWIDYLAPQVYFSTKSVAVPYQTMLNWWQENSFGRHIYIGHAVYKINNDKYDQTWNNPSELSEQIRIMRGRSGMAAGSVFYRSRFLQDNPFNVQDSLKANFYRFKALPPVFTWIDNTPPPPPMNLTVSGSRKGAVLNWQAEETSDPFEQPTYFIVYRFENGQDLDIENPANIAAILRQKECFYIDPNVRKNKKYRYIVTAVDRLHNESIPTKSDLFKYKRSYLKQ